MQHHVAHYLNPEARLQGETKATQNAASLWSARRARRTSPARRGGHAGFAEARSYPPRGPTSPQANTPSPRSHPLSSRLILSFFLFFKKKAHTPCRWLRGDDPRASAGAALGRGGRLPVPSRGGVLEKHAPEGARGSTAGTSLFEGSGYCLMDKWGRAVDNCKCEASTQPACPPRRSGSGRAHADHKHTASGDAKGRFEGHLKRGGRLQSFLN